MGNRTGPNNYCQQCGAEVEPIIKKGGGLIANVLKAIDDNITGVFICGMILSGVGAAFGTGIYKMYDAAVQGDVEKARIQAGYQLKTGHLNGNKQLDTYYLIDGKPAVVELDGEPVVDESSLEAKF